MSFRSHPLVATILVSIASAGPAAAQQPIEPLDCPGCASHGGTKPASPPGEPPPVAAPADRVVIPPDPGLSPAAGSTSSVSAQAQPVVDVEDEEPVHARTLHGFRLGYMYVSHFDKQTDPEDPESSLKERVDMKSPHLFLIGYEVMRRLVGHSWLNIILVGNVTVGGLEQSKFYPSGNALIGFEFEESFQLGVGPNLTPDPGKVAHIMFAAGWTPRVGSFHVPVHAFYIPDVDGIWRSGATVGVNW
jgi:hypothetical protein